MESRVNLVEQHYLSLLFTSREKSDSFQPGESKGLWEASPDIPDYYPAWYHRVRRLVARRELDESDDDLGPDSEDFDEDISERMSEDSFDCFCSSWETECACRPDLCDIEYTAEDEEYLFYKHLREDRKEELAELRRDRKRMIRKEEKREQQVEKALAATKDRETQGGIEAERLKLGPSARFTLHSSEYWHSLPLPKVKSGQAYIKFFAPVEKSYSRDTQQPIRTVSGHIHFHGTNHQLVAFYAPKRTGLSSVSIGIQGHDAKLAVTFIDQSHLRVVIPRHIIDLPPSTSQGSRTNDLGTVEFVGRIKAVISSHEKERKRKRELEDDLDHPSGSNARSLHGSPG